MLMRSVVSEILKAGHLRTIEVWADAQVLYHTVRCLTLEPSYGLKASVTYNLDHAVLSFSPRATDIKSHVAWYLDYFHRQAEEERDIEEAQEVVEQGLRVFNKEGENLPTEAEALALFTDGTTPSE